jgi:hypothetical protein
MWDIPKANYAEFTLIVSITHPPLPTAKNPNIKLDPNSSTNPLRPIHLPNKTNNLPPLPPNLQTHNLATPSSLCGNNNNIPILRHLHHNGSNLVHTKYGYLMDEFLRRSYRPNPLQNFRRPFNLSKRFQHLQ